VAGLFAKPCPFDKKAFRQISPFFARVGAKNISDVPEAKLNST